MKRLIFVAVVLALFVGFAGCDKDEGITRANLIGDWIVVKFNGDAYNVQHTFTFKENGGFEELVIIHGVTKSYSGTYQLDEEEGLLFVTKDNHTQMKEIVTLTSSKFTFKDYAGDTFDLERP